jgi:hypothetical protein
MGKAFDEWFEGYIQGLGTGFDGGHEAAHESIAAEVERLRAIEAATVRAYEHVQSEYGVCVFCDNAQGHEEECAYWLLSERAKREAAE